MNYDSNKIKLAKYNRKAFTFMEVVMAVVILAFVAASILEVMNRNLAAAMDSRTEKQAFEIARENMEFLLSAEKVSEKTEFGISEINPDIQWETVIETFTEPATNTMWLQAVCSASYTDKDNEIRSVELTHWLSEVPKDIQAKIKAQKQKELELMGEYAEDLEEDVRQVELLEEEYKQKLAEALGIDPDRAADMKLAVLEDRAEREGYDLYDFGKDELDDAKDTLRKYPVFSNMTPGQLSLPDIKSISEPAINKPTTNRPGKDPTTMPEPEQEYNEFDPTKPFGPGNWGDATLEEMLQWYKDNGYMN